MTSESDGLTSCSEPEDELDKPLVKKLRVSENLQKTMTTPLDEADEVRKLVVMRDKLIKHQNLVEKSMRIRAKLGEAHLWHGGEARKKAVFKEMKDLAMTKRVFAETGIGCLVNDGNFWPLEICDQVKELEVKWRALPNKALAMPKDEPHYGIRAVGTCHLMRSILKPFAGMKAKKFVDMMDAMIVELRRWDPEICAYTVYKQAAITLLSISTVKLWPSSRVCWRWRSCVSPKFQQLNNC